MGNSKIATKKALDTYQQETGITNEQIENCLLSLYPDEFDKSIIDETIKEVLKRLFKTTTDYIKPNDTFIRDTIEKMHEKNELRRYTIEYQIEKKLSESTKIFMNKLLEIVNTRNVYLSEIPEFNSDVKTYLLRHEEDDEWCDTLAKCISREYKYYYSDSDIELHCHTQKNDDIYFSQDKIEYIEEYECYENELTDEQKKKKSTKKSEEDNNNSGCLVAIIAVVITILLFILIFHGDKLF